MRRSILFLLCPILCGLLIACGQSSPTTASGTTPTAAPTTAPTPTPTQNAAPVPKVGVAFVVNNTWTVTVNSIKKSQGDEFTTPAANSIFLLVDVTVKNTSASTQNLSSIGNFTLTDSTGQRYAETFLSTGVAPDGSVTPRHLLRGQLVYEIPMSEHTFLFAFQPNYEGTDIVEWTLSV